MWAILEMLPVAVERRSPYSYRQAGWDNCSYRWGGESRDGSSWYSRNWQGAAYHPGLGIRLPGSSRSLSRGSLPPSRDHHAPTAPPPFQCFLWRQQVTAHIRGQLPLTQCVWRAGGGENTDTQMVRRLLQVPLLLTKQRDSWVRSHSPKLMA